MNAPRTDDELRAWWRAHGGSFHGPKVEHGIMPEEKLLPLLRSLLTHPGVAAALRTVLDQVDYTADACGPTEMVGACLPQEVIKLARAALRGEQ